MPNHGAELATKSAQFAQRFLKDGGEGEESKRVTSRCGVEDDDRVFHGFDVPGMGRRQEYKRRKEIDGRTS